MGPLLEALKSPERSTRWGGIAGFAVWLVLMLLTEWLKPCCGFWLPIPTELVALLPTGTFYVVQNYVRDEYAPGKPLLTAQERAALAAQQNLTAQSAEKELKS